MSVFCKHGWAGSNCKECNIEMLEAQLANAEQEIERLREALAAAYIELSGKDEHASDCATSNAPAMTPGRCDCD
jgi:uncharacterized coiled-coil protein SlyX